MLNVSKGTGPTWRPDGLTHGRMTSKESTCLEVAADKENWRKTKRMLLPAIIATLGLLVVLGCADPLTVPKLQIGQPLSRALITDGAAFNAGDNPFIYNQNGVAGSGRNSSDPAAVWAPTAQGNKVLMVTSNDLKKQVPVSGTNNYYPMDQTFLYAWDPLATGQNAWRDFGAIASEKDIPWSDDTQDHLWAPDIDYKGNTYFVYVPAGVKGTSPITQRIAVFNRAPDPFGKFVYSDYLHIKNADNTEVGYAYDPGVFHLGVGADWTDYYIAYCDAEYPNGRIHIAQFTAGGSTQAKELGKVQITGIPGDYYMEGPDLLLVNGTGDRQQPAVILQFAAKVVSSEQEYIGYAYKTQDSFKADPVNNWTFGGWIQKQIDPSPGNNPSAETAEWTNHATIVPVQLSGSVTKYYYMYQFSQGDNVASDGQMRQVSMRELHFNPGLTIQGVSTTDAFHYLDHESYPFDGIAYTGQTADSEKSNTTKAHPWFYINNPTDSSATGWDFLYFFRTENGKTPLLENVRASGFTANLRQFGANVWAADFYNAATMAGRNQNPNWGQFPQSGDGFDFTIRYSDNSVFDKSNDFSEPRSGAFTDTDYLPLFSNNGRMAGRNPKLKLTSVWTANSGRTLTASTETVGGDHLAVGMPAQPWNTQEWELEPVPGTAYVRIKDTAWGVYLNLNSQNEREKVTLHSLVPDWWSEQWVVYPTGQIQNRWSLKYLTRGNPNDNLPHDRDDYITVWSQDLNPGWDSQKWIVEYE